MFVFAHIGITLGAAVAVTGIVESWQAGVFRRRLPVRETGSGGLAEDPGGFSLDRWVDGLGKYIDLRLLAIGALLPDIIDKPLGLFLFGGGRSIAHSLLVTLLVLLVGLFLKFNFRRTAVLAIALGMAGHLILDAMWAIPETLFWPSYGLAFPVATASGVTTGAYAEKWALALTTDSSLILTEGIGLAIIGVLAGMLASRRKLSVFLKRGRF